MSRSATPLRVVSKPPLRVVAGVLIDDCAVRVLVAQRAAGSGPRAGLWEFPGGKVEPGETDEQALARELEEELGIHAIVGECLGEQLVHYDDLSIALVAYRCTLAPGSAQPECREHAELRWVDGPGLAPLSFSGGDTEIAVWVGAMLG